MTMKTLLLGTTAAIGLIALGTTAAPNGECPGGAPRRRARPDADRLCPLPGARRRSRQRPPRSRRSRPASTSRTTPRSMSCSVASTIRAASSMAARSSSRPTPTASDNTDETWLFLRGGFGEVRFGDEDGVADNSSVGAQVIAAGTGGIDGSVIDTIAHRRRLSDQLGRLRPRSATTPPRFGGFSARRPRYTPNQARRSARAVATVTAWRSTDVEAGDIFEGGLIYEGDFGGFGLLASAGRHRWRRQERGRGRRRRLSRRAGRRLDRAFGFEVAGSLATEKVGAAEKDVLHAGRRPTASARSTSRSPTARCSTSTTSRRPSTPASTRTARSARQAVQSRPLGRLSR